MKIYTLRQKQKLPISMTKAWDFLSDPNNLKRITPEYMTFKIIDGNDRKMFPGQIIQYVVTPVWGIKTTWVTEITHVEYQKYFVDEQRFGPYVLWHHKHFIKPIYSDVDESMEKGVEMEDIIHYKLPFKFFGELLHSIIVAPKLKEIFDFRRKKLIEFFGEYDDSLKSTVKK